MEPGEGRSMKRMIVKSVILTLAVVIQLTLFSNAASASINFRALKFEDLRPRLLLKATDIPVSGALRAPELIFTGGEYSPRFSYVFSADNRIKNYLPNQLFRIQYFSESDDQVFDFDSQTLKSTGYKVYRLFLLAADENLKTSGDLFQITTKPRFDLAELARLRWIDGLTYEEIGRRLGKTKNAIALQCGLIRRRNFEVGLSASEIQKIRRMIQ